MVISEQDYKAAKKIVTLYEKRDARKFYQDELVGNEGKPLHSYYQQLVDFLFGNNIFGHPFDSVLSLEYQLSFSQFEKLVEISNKTGKKFSDILITMENDAKYTKGKKSLYMTLNNWLAQRFTKQY